MRFVPAEQHNAELIKWLKANGCTKYHDDVRRLCGERVTVSSFSEDYGAEVRIMTPARWPKWLREHHANQESST